jgi:hypothetical protein
LIIKELAMAQAMLDKNNLSFKKFSTISTQTEENPNEFCIYIANNKTFRVYNSKTYKENVLSFNFGNSKKYIITKQMWKIFREYILQIDNILLNN